MCLRDIRPDLETPTRADAESSFPFLQAMLIPYVDLADISHAVEYLASDESRYVTGQQLVVDAGAGLKMGRAVRLPRNPLHDQPAVRRSRASR